MSEVAKAGKGVVLLLGNPLTGPQLLAQLTPSAAADPAAHSTVGAGSQILRDLAAHAPGWRRDSSTRYPASIGSCRIPPGRINQRRRAVRGAFVL